MADQDLEINVRTTADTSGIKEIEAHIAELKARAESLRAALAPVPPGLGGPPGAPLPHFPPLPPKGPEDTDNKIAEHVGRGLERMAIHAIGIGAIYEFLDAIKKSAEQINKITESLEKQGETLVKNAQLMAEASKFAQDQADVIKIGESGLKGVAEQHKNVVELQKQELGYWQQLLDSIAKGGQLGAGPLQQALDDAIASAQAFEQQARKSAAFDQLTAQLNIARRESQGFDENVQEITKHILEQEAIQDRVGPDNIEDYVKAGKAAEGYRKQLAEVIKLEEQRIKAAKAAAAPLAKALTTPTGTFVSQQVKAEQEHQAERAALEQKRREAVATGDTDRAKAIGDQLKYDKFGQNQRKEALQRYVANQESLLGGDTSPANLIKQLGTQGAKQFQSAQDELDKSFAQQKLGRPETRAESAQRERAERDQAAKQEAQDRDRATIEQQRQRALAGEAVQAGYVSPEEINKQYDERLKKAGLDKQQAGTKATAGDVETHKLLGQLLDLFK